MPTATITLDDGNGHRVSVDFKWKDSPEGEIVDISGPDAFIFTVKRRLQRKNPGYDPSGVNGPAPDNYWWVQGALNYHATRHDMNVSFSGEQPPSDWENSGDVVH